MKKSLCLILSILLIVVSFCSCSMVKDENILDEYTYVDDKGQTHEYATDTSGEIVTQKGGEKETTKSTTKKDGGSNKDSTTDLDVGFDFYATDANGENVTDKEGNLVTSKVDFEEMLNEMTNTTTGKSGDTGSAPGGITGSLENSDKDDLLEEGDKINKTSLKSKVIDPVVKSKKYTLSTTIVAQDMRMPMTMCINGDEYAASMEMSMSSLKISARVFSEKGKFFLVIPILGMYSEVDAETSEDISQPSGDLTSTSTYVKSTKVKDGTTTYICEEYKSKDGKTTKFYFNEKNEWKRWEVISGEDITVFEVNKFEGKVDEKMFKIPRGLKKVDFDTLM